MSSSQRYLIVIVGPTAVGKTAISIELAKYFGTSIVSADSRQFFKEMNIGTAKPSEYELNQVPHYLVGHKSITEHYNAGEFEKEAITIIEKVLQQKESVFLVGGSGLYIDAVCKGLDVFPDTDFSIREELNALFEKEGLSKLRALLKECDPIYYEMVDINNPQRIMKALEVYRITNIPYSQFIAQKKKERPFKIIKIGLNCDQRDQLYARINKRVDEMFEAGLLKEAETLLKYRNHNALKTVGYKEVYMYLDGLIEYHEMVELIKKNTRNFAKRQLTWFRKSEDVKWFNVLEADLPDKMIKYLKNYLKKH